MKLRFARGAPRAALLVVCVGAFAGAGLSARVSGDGFQPGLAAVAEMYVVWAEQAIADGRMAQAQAALERAGDFADSSSDVSYLLAYVRARNGESRFLVLQALEKAISVNRWRRYDEARARLLQAEHLVALRRFYAALGALDARGELAAETTDSALLRLRALKGLALAAWNPPGSTVAGDPFATEFRRLALETMNRDPRDPRPPRILFGYAAGRALCADDRALVEEALRRLPFLLDADPALAWMAVPFIRDDEEARRLLAAYRAGSFVQNPQDFVPNPASIPHALNLGLLDDADAIDELFAFAVGEGGGELDKDLITAVGDLLRGDDGRDFLAQRLHSFTGAIVWDDNRDGIAENRAVFQDGVLRAFLRDADQDGFADLRVEFYNGLPTRAEFVALPEAAPFLATPPGEVAWGSVAWFRYPLVETVTLRGETFAFAPGGLFYSPIRFASVGASETYEGLLVPALDWLSQGLTRRALVMSAISVERACLEFEGGRERLYLSHGEPVLSRVTADGLIVSVTEFERGFPVVQRVDLDRDGRLETVRRFHPGTGALMSSESDWDGDGFFEHVEVYLRDGSIVRN